MDTEATMETATERNPEFHIESDGAADWYLKQLACYDAEMALLTEQHKAAVKRLHFERAGLENLYSAELEQYIAQKIAVSKGGRKSVILPHGTCAFRTVPGGLRIVDELAALAFVEGQPCEQDVTRKVLVRDAYLQIAKEELEADGELWAGVEMTPERESFSVKFGKGGE